MKKAEQLAEEYAKENDGTLWKEYSSIMRNAFLAGFAARGRLDAEIAASGTKRSLYSWSEGPGYSEADKQWEIIIETAKQIALEIKALDERVEDESSEGGER